MTTHATKSGSIELLHSWGHGKGGNGLTYYRRPACLVFDDGDGHYSAWKVAGTMRDAATTIGSIHTARHSDCIAVLDGSTARVESLQADSGFWIEGEHGDYRPDLSAYPDVVAY